MPGRESEAFFCLMVFSLRFTKCIMEYLTATRLPGQKDVIPDPNAEVKDEGEQLSVMEQIMQKKAEKKAKRQAEAQMTAADKRKAKRSASKQMIAETSEDMDSASVGMFHSRGGAARKIWIFPRR